MNTKIYTQLFTGVVQYNTFLTFLISNRLVSNQPSASKLIRNFRASASLLQVFMQNWKQKFGERKRLCEIGNIY